MLTAADAVALIDFSSEEQKYLKLFENSIDAGLMQFTGQPLPIGFDQLMTPKLAFRLKRDYEAAGWSVQIGSITAIGECKMLFSAGDVSKSKIKHLLALKKSNQDLLPLAFYRPPTLPEDEGVKGTLLRMKEMRELGNIDPITLSIDKTYSVAAIQRLHALECTMLVNGAPKIADRSKMMFSILICTIPSRKDMCKRLVSYLNSQCNHNVVEIITDDGEGTIGAKRQRLLEKARGEFVAFVDDDDMVSVDYIERICKTIVANPNATHLSLTGEVTTDGGQIPDTFVNSTKYERWNDVHYLDGRTFYERAPSHLSPIRREIALKVGYDKNLHYIEDRMFSDQVRPFLTNETDTGSGPLYFYFIDSEKSNQSRMAYERGTV